MQGWQPSVLKNFSLALLELLRARFMAARDYMGMKEVNKSIKCECLTVTYLICGSSGDRMFKLMACGASGLRFGPLVWPLI